MMPSTMETLLEVRGVLNQILPNVFRERLPELSEHYRQQNVRLLLTTELVFPLVYRGFSAVLITYLFSRWLAPTSPWRFVSLLPLVGMLADYCENTLVLTILFAYPRRLDGVATAANAITRLKWASNYVDWTLIAVGLIALLAHTVITIINKRSK